MSQRARAHTTGATRTTTDSGGAPTPAVTPPASEAPLAAPASLHALPHAAPLSVTDALRDTSASMAGAASAAVAADGAPMAGAGGGIEPLARALRAMATELERDPCLARRVADAMQAPALAARSVAPVPSGPATPAVAQATAATAPDNSAVDATDATDATDAQVGAAPTHVNRTFHPRIVTGTPPELGAGVPDPFALAERLGESGLRAALAELRLGSLRAIVREHRLDPTGRLVGVNDAAKFRVVIVEAVRATHAAAAAPKRSKTIDRSRPKQV